MPETRSDAEAKRKVWEMIKDIDIAMMVTQDDQGRFRGRPMRAVNKEFDGVLWFFATAGSAVTGEAASDGRVLLAYSSADNRLEQWALPPPDHWRDVALRGRMQALAPASREGLRPGLSGGGREVGDGGRGVRPRWRWMRSARGGAGVSAGSPCDPECECSDCDSDDCSGDDSISDYCV